VPKATIYHKQWLQHEDLNHQHHWKAGKINKALHKAHEEQ